MGRASRRKRELTRAERVPTPAVRTPVDPLGAVAVLSVGAGDLTLSFDKSKPAERDHARTVVQDMLARGYAILVQVDTKDGEPVYQRAKAFDPETCEYLIVGVSEAKPAKEPKAHRAPKLTTTRVPAERTRAVAVARTAGG